MLTKTRGIVFKTMKYGETSLIADIYTEEMGLRRYIVNGVRTPKARVSASLLQAMSLVDLVAYERPDRDLHRLKEIRPAYVYQSIPFDVRRGAVGLFMAEVARKTLHEAEENRRLFAFLYDIFVHLDASAQAVANLHLYFLLELSLYIGFMPGGACSAQTPFFDLQEGVFVPLSSHHVHCLDEADSQLLHQLLQSSPDTCHSVAMSAEQRRAMLQHLLSYYALHIENMPDINAHVVLREVLG